MKKGFHGWCLLEVKKITTEDPVEIYTQAPSSKASANRKRKASTIAKAAVEGDAKDYAAPVGVPANIEYPKLQPRIHDLPKQPTPKQLNISLNANRFLQYFKPYPFPVIE